MNNIYGQGLGYVQDLGIPISLTEQSKGRVRECKYISDIVLNQTVMVTL